MDTLTETYQEYKAPLLGFIRKRVPTLEVAEDILQDVFYQFVKATDLLNPIEQVSGWLYKVAKNSIINWRSKKKETMLLDVVDGEDAEVFEDIADILLTNPDTPETELLRSVIMDELEAGLSELPQEQREVFVEMEINGMSVKELSAKTGVPTATLLSRKHYAVIYLRKRLRALYDDINQ
ncbi:MAG: sigma-70 family RNA polymerase sigma factor [Ignavibacteria bacterium]|jgi:RNA polymerase sigma factor (sigma-70 family)|nr:sigma-70 family RNA polymerase sigma factor [Ignavibacteria bacterium]